MDKRPYAGLDLEVMVFVLDDVIAESVPCDTETGPTCWPADDDTQS